MLSKVPVVRGAVLNDWEAIRTIMPERSYRPPQNAPPIKYTSTHCNYFPAYPIQAYPKAFQQHLEKSIKHYKEYSQRPASCISGPRLLEKNFRGVMTDKVPRGFGWDKHTSWHGFQKLFMNRPEFKEVIEKPQTAMPSSRINYL